MLYNNGGNKRPPTSSPCYAATPTWALEVVGWGVERGVGGVCTHIKTINFAVIYLNLNVATMHAAAGWQWGVCCLLARSLLAWPFCLNNKAAKSMQQFLYYAQLLALSRARHIHMYIMLRILWR